MAPYYLRLKNVTYKEMMKAQVDAEPNFLWIGAVILFPENMHNIAVTCGTAELIKKWKSLEGFPVGYGTLIDLNNKLKLTCEMNEWKKFIDSFPRNNIDNTLRDERYKRLMLKSSTLNLLDKFWQWYYI